jgi:glutamyl-tRNA reductase
MNLRLIGVNHKSAPVDVRERVAIPESRLGEAMARLLQQPGVSEGLIISTCNRVEVLVAETSSTSCDLAKFLADYCNADLGALAHFIYEYRGREALRHTFQVACSLDSLVVGEPQVLGQVKDAYATARQVGAVRADLDAVLRHTFAVAKRVRSETAIGSSSLSVASAAVDLAKQIFGTLTGKHVYLVGAGKMSELAARHLVAHGATAIFVASRNYEHAHALAAKFSGRALLFEQLYDTADQADIVITSTGAPHAIFRREHGECFLQRRKNRPMFFVDIAVPRDVDAEMGKLDGIFLYNIDDLQSLVSANAANRAREAERAAAIIETEIDRFEARLQTREVAPTIVSLQEHLETIRQAEIDRVRGRLGKLTPEQELAIDALTRGIVNKVLHTPMTALKSAARDSRATSVVESIHRVFNLNLDSKPQARKEEEQPSAATGRPASSRGSRGN